MAKVIIILDKTEQRLATYIARARSDINKKKGVKDMQQGPQVTEDMEQSSIGGEVAFCKALNIYPNMAVEEPDDGVDCYLPDGRSVGIKTTGYENGHLSAPLWTPNKKVIPDIFALMVGAFPEYRLAGYMKSTELLQDHRIKKLGATPTFTAEQRELLNINKWDVR